jgi:hypothetical protein
VDDGGVAGGEEGADHGGRHLGRSLGMSQWGLSSEVLLVARLCNG